MHNCDVPMVIIAVSGLLQPSQLFSHRSIAICNECRKRALHFRFRCSLVKAPVDGIRSHRKRYRFALENNRLLFGLETLALALFQYFSTLLPILFFPFMRCFIIADASIRFGVVVASRFSQSLKMINGRAINILFSFLSPSVFNRNNIFFSLFSVSFGHPPFCRSSHSFLMAF